MDANSQRQLRFDRVKTRTICPRCNAQPGDPCFRKWIANLSKEELEERATHAGMSMGKSTLNAHAMVALISDMVKVADMRAGKNVRDIAIGGLHKERRAAYAVDVITRLGDLVRPAEEVERIHE